MPFWKISLIKHLGLNCIRYVHDTKRFEVTWKFLVDPTLQGVTAPKTWSWLTVGHCSTPSRNEQNRWAVSHRASTPDISLSLLLTSINMKQFLRSCDEEGCLTINQLISRRELMVIPLRAPQTRGETFQLGISEKHGKHWTQGLSVLN